MNDIISKENQLAMLSEEAILTEARQNTRLAAITTLLRDDSIPEEIRVDTASRMASFGLFSTSLFEWKVVDHQSKESAKAEQDLDGFEFFKTIFNEPSKTYRNIFRKRIILNRT